MDYKKIKTEEDFERWFNSLTYLDMRDALKELIEKVNAFQPSKIRMSMEQFSAMFEIQGFKISEDGNMEPHMETRGRKKSVLTEEDIEARRERTRAYQRELYQRKKGKKESAAAK